MRQPPRGIDIGTHQDTFLVCAVVTIIVIRLQLWYTDYPQLGGGGLHIAHLLYGGAFMVLAIALLSSYLGRPRRLPSAVLAGVGFGFFIDETGKFVTDSPSPCGWSSTSQACSSSASCPAPSWARSNPASTPTSSVTWAS
jgi:hypothetical protein